MNNADNQLNGILWNDNEWNHKLLFINEAFAKGFTTVYKKESYTFAFGDRVWVKTLDANLYETHSDKVAEQIGEFIDKYKHWLDADEINKFRNHLQGRITKIQNVTSGIWGKVRWIYFCVFRSGWKNIQTQKKSLEEVSKKVTLVYKEKKGSEYESPFEVKSKSISFDSPEKGNNREKRKNGFSRGSVTPISGNLTGLKKIPGSAKRTPLRNTPSKFQVHHPIAPFFFVPPPPLLSSIENHQKKFMFDNEPKEPEFQGKVIPQKIDASWTEEQLKEQIQSITTYLEELSKPIENLQKILNEIDVFNTIIPENESLSLGLETKKFQYEDNLSYLSSKNENEILHLNHINKDKTILVPISNFSKFPNEISNSQKTKEIEKRKKIFELKTNIHVYKTAVEAHKIIVEENNKKNEKIKNQKQQTIENYLQLHNSKKEKELKINNYEELKKLLTCKRKLFQQWERGKLSREKAISKRKIVQETNKDNEIIIKGINDSTPTKPKHKLNFEVEGNSTTPPHSKSPIKQSKSQLEENLKLLEEIEFDQQSEINLRNSSKVLELLKDEKLSSEEAKEFVDTLSNSIYIFLHRPSSQK